MTNPKLIALAVAMVLAGTASAEPLRESIDRNKAVSSGTTDTSTATIGVPALVASNLAKMAPLQLDGYAKLVFESADGLKAYQAMQAELINIAGGPGGYQAQRAAALRESGVPVAKALAKDLAACKTEQCVREFAYRDKVLTLLVPTTFESKRLALAETKLMGRRHINDARFRHYMPASVAHAEISNNLLDAATKSAKLPKAAAALSDAVILGLYRMPFAQFDQLSHVSLDFGDRDRVNHAEPGTPIEYYYANTGRVYKLADEGVTVTANGAPYFDGRHLSGKELTVSASGNKSVTGTTTTSY